MEISSNFEITQQYLNALQNKHSTTNSFADSLTNQTQISKEELLEQLSHISNNDNFNEKISSMAQNMSESDLKLFTFVLNESNNMNYYSPVLLGGKNIDKVNSQESIAITEKFVFNSDEDAIDFIDESLKHLEKSIKNNIVEGYGRKRYKQEFIRFLVFAHASCDEADLQLTMIDEIYFESKGLTDLISEYEILGRKIYKFMEYVEQNWNESRT
jgi:four helix bundle protein